MLLSRFGWGGKEHSPCGERSPATSIAAQQTVSRWDACFGGLSEIGRG